MHEMSLAQGILQVVLDAAKDEKVRKISLQVGRLQMVVPESLRFSFKLMAEGTAAAEANLEIEEIPTSLRCGHCGADVELDLPPFSCGKCGASDIEIVSGDEVLIDSVEVGNAETRARCVPVIGPCRHLEAHVTPESGHYV